MATDIGRVKAHIEYGVQEYMEIGGWGDDAEVHYSYESAKRSLCGSHTRVVKRAVTEWEDVKPLSVLRCAADYRDAPHGTKVAKRGLSGWWRKVDGAWIDESGAVMPNSPVSTSPRKVLEWGAV